ncbi:hypothetical protein TNCV_2130821 [Trichonephila clavipes]|nr:hypothetical protein TNCV_2130821 [Trichonephila clavipes]
MRNHNDSYFQSDIDCQKCQNLDLWKMIFRRLSISTPLSGNRNKRKETPPTTHTAPSLCCVSVTQRSKQTADALPEEWDGQHLRGELFFPYKL